MAVKLKGQIKKLGTAQKFDENANARVVLTVTLEVDGADGKAVDELVEMQRGPGGVQVSLVEVQARLPKGGED